MKKISILFLALGLMACGSGADKCKDSADKCKDKENCKEACEAKEKVAQLMEETPVLADDEIYQLEDMQTSSAAQGKIKTTYAYVPDYVQVTGTHVRLRWSPSKKNDKNIFKDRYGNPIYPEKYEVLRCVGKKDNWYNVVYLGNYLWISCDFCRPYNS